MDQNEANHCQIVIPISPTEEMDETAALTPENCFSNFHHQMCKKLAEQALQIERLHQTPDSLRMEMVERERTMMAAALDEIEQIKLEFKAKELEVERRCQIQLDDLTRILVEQVAIQKQMKEQYTRKMNDMKVEQDTMLQMIMSADMTGGVAMTMQRAEEETTSLCEMVMEKHELLLALGKLLDEQAARIRELEATTSNSEGKVPAAERATTTNASDLNSAQTAIEGLQVALAEMQAKLNNVQIVAESREHDLSDELSLLRSVLRLTKDTVAKRDPSTGLVYFLNTSTGESRWAHPAAGETEQLVDGAEQTTATRTISPNNKTPSEQPLAENQRMVTDFEHPLPEGWVAMIDISTKQTYFFNKSTGESRWDMPVAKHTGSVLG